MFTVYHSYFNIILKNDDPYVTQDNNHRLQQVVIELLSKCSVSYAFFRIVSKLCFFVVFIKLKFKVAFLFLRIYIVYINENTGFFYRPKMSVNGGTKSF